MPDEHVPGPAVTAVTHLLRRNKDIGPDATIVLSIKYLARKIDALSMLAETKVSVFSLGPEDTLVLTVNGRSREWIEQMRDCAEKAFNCKVVIMEGDMTLSQLNQGEPT